MPFNFSGWELIIVLVVGLLIFGSRLPSVGRNLGKGIVEFKKGLKGVEDEVRMDEERNQYRPAQLKGDDRRVAQPPAMPAGAGNPVQVTQVDAPQSQAN